MMEAVFQSTSQCLAVSFLMESLPVSQESFMQQVIDERMKELGIWEGSAPADRTVNFSGLSRLEIRGQCAMVRASVAHHLAGHTAAAVHARYSMKRTMKAQAVRTLLAWCQPALATQDGMAGLAIVWNVFCTAAQREDLSVRRIADEFSLAKSSVGRDVQTVRRMTADLELQAVNSLQPMFQTHKLVE
jgi:hypothetical protein